MKLKKVVPILIVVITVLSSGLLKKDIFTLEIQGSHVWRQSQTSLNIRNFTRHDFNILNPRTASFNKGDSNIKRMEFPLMQWLIAGVQRIFGENILVVRICMFLTYLFTVGGVFLALKQLFKSPMLSAIGVYIFSFFPVYLYQSINPLPDNFALGLILFFIYFFLLGVEREDGRFISISAFFLTLAALVKLPFIIYGVFPFIYVIKNSKTGKLLKPTLIAFSITLIPVLFWYYLSIPEWGGNKIAFGIFDSSVDAETYFMFLGQQLTNNIPLVVLGKTQSYLFVLALLVFFTNKIFKFKFSRYFVWGG